MPKIKCHGAQRVYLLTWQHLLRFDGNAVLSVQRHLSGTQFIFACRRLFFSAFLLLVEMEIFESCIHVSCVNKRAARLYQLKTDDAEDLTVICFLCFCLTVLNLTEQSLSELLFAALIRQIWMNKSHYLSCCHPCVVDGGKTGNNCPGFGFWRGKRCISDSGHISQTARQTVQNDTVYIFSFMCNLSTCVFRSLLGF